MTTTINLDERQLAHVLASLRAGQSSLAAGMAIANSEHFEDVDGGHLRREEVDALCEAINCSPVLKAEPVAHDGTPLDPVAMHHALIGLIEWDAFMGFNGAVVWRNARLAIGHPVEAAEDDTNSFVIVQPSPPADPPDRDRDTFIAFARSKYANPSDDDIEIDDDASFSRATGEGTWVAAWVWVYDTDVEQG